MPNPLTISVVADTKHLEQQLAILSNGLATIASTLDEMRAQLTSLEVPK